MSETKWTEGPWETDPEFDHEVVLCADGTMVADCCIFVNPSMGDRSTATNQANARLIAAAPDLAEALEATISLLKAFVGPDDELGQTTISMGTAALARAKGAS